MREAADRIGEDDVLTKIDARMEWRLFSPILKRCSGRSGSWPQGYDPLVLFKCLLIGQWHGLSAPKLERALKLRGDGEEYVRRSVANNINDIAKDHPEVVAELASKWMQNADKNTTSPINHACCTLIKRGHAPTLAVLGYGKPQIAAAELRILSPIVVLGEHFEFELDLTSATKASQPLIVDFVIHYRMANGGTSAKVYKWKNINLAAGKSVSLAKRFALKQITTRTFYAGKHGFEVQINGETIASDTFNLSL